MAVKDKFILVEKIFESRVLEDLKKLERGSIPQLVTIARADKSKELHLGLPC